jgi:hypothetical protein
MTVWLLLLLWLGALSVSGSTQKTDQINGPYHVRKGMHYSNKTSVIWGDNGKLIMSNVITLSESCTSYDNSQANCSSSWMSDWNKLWGKARCGYLHDHHQDSDRFVWRRCPDASCIQLAAYSYDNGVVPYPANPDLLKPFDTTILPGVAYNYTLSMDASGVSKFTLSDVITGNIIEEQVVMHVTKCTENFNEGTLQGFYFGGKCTAPQEVSVIYSSSSSSSSSLTT